MKLEKTRIPDVVLITPKVFPDQRGFFMETWQQRAFADAGLDAQFTQDSHSCSARGTLRGLHYQMMHAQGKLTRVVKGEVFDVAVDLRKSSATFGQWVGEHLSAENKKQLWVPPGFAHGFLVLSEEAHFLYKSTDDYAPEFERTLRWDDPHIGIDWPIAVGEQPLLSEKDKAGVALSEAEVYP